MVGTVTIQRKEASPQHAEELSDVQNTSPTLLIETTLQGDKTIERPDNSIDTEVQSKEITLSGDEGNGLSAVASKGNELVSGTSEEMSTQESEVESDGNASPSKFVINKTSGGKPGVGKKLSIVDKLHNKFLCVAEALKDTITPVDNVTLEDEAENVTDVDITLNDVVAQVMELPKAQVLLHDLKENSVIIESFKNNNKEVMSTSSNIDNSEKSSVIIPSEPGSQVRSEISESGSPESDASGKVDKSTKRKCNNIDDVVRNLTERRSSIDEKTESRNEQPVLNPILLDDSNNDGDVLVIDEEDLSDRRSPPPNGKQDRNCRKSIPAQVLNKSSDLLESSPASHINVSAGKEVVETAVRAEVANTDAITLVLGNDEPQHKVAPKKLRSVNLSKSLSLSVINNSIVEEIESNDSDSESGDGIIIEHVVETPFVKPRARKTFPNLPKPLEVARGRNITVTQTKQNNPTSYNISGTIKTNQRQTSIDPPRQSTASSNSRQSRKMFNSNKAAGSSSELPARQSQENHKPASVQLEEAVNKVKDPAFYITRIKYGILL